MHILLRKLAGKSQFLTGNIWDRRAYWSQYVGPQVYCQGCTGYPVRPDNLPDISYPVKIIRHRIIGHYPANYPVFLFDKKMGVKMNFLRFSLVFQESNRRSFHLAFIEIQYFMGRTLQVLVVLYWPKRHSIMSKQ